MNLLLVVWAAAGVAAWFLWVRRLGPWAAPEESSRRFGRADIVLSTLLAALFLLSIAAATSVDRPPVTRNMILDNGVIQLCIVSILFAVLAVRGRNVVAMFGLAPARPLKVFGMAFLCLAATYPIVALLAELATHWGSSPSGEDAMVTFLRDSPDWRDRAVGIAFALVVAPFVEECIFRGYLYGVVRQYAGRVAGILTTSVLFAAVHPNLPAVPALFVLSVGLTLAYERTGSLFASIAMHFLFNAATVCAIFFFPETLR